MTAREGPASTLTQYELINPSDKIVFDAPSHEVAALAALIVGLGKYGAVTYNDQRTSVIGLALFGGDGGYRDNYGRDFADGLNALGPEAVAACHSFRLANGHRSSLNDICGYAHQFKLRVPTP